MAKRPTPSIKPIMHTRNELLAREDAAYAQGWQDCLLTHVVELLRLSDKSEEKLKRVRERLKARGLL